MSLGEILWSWGLGLRFLQPVFGGARGSGLKGILGLGFEGLGFRGLEWG